MSQKTKKFFAIAFLAVAVMGFAADKTAAQPPFKIPKLPKIEMPTGKKDSPKPTPTPERNSRGEIVTLQKSGLSGPAIIKYSLKIRAEQHSVAKSAKYVSAWSPRLMFDLLGPLPTGSQLQASFTDSTGKPWLEYDIGTPDIPAGRSRTITDNRQPDEKSSTQTGTFGFRIVLKNELQGAAQELYKGTFKVGKIAPRPDFPDKLEYYVDQDWLLPIGFAYPNYRFDEKAPPLTLAVWFRQIPDTVPGETSQNFQGVLFYNGQQLTDTKTEQYNTVGEEGEFGSAGHTRYAWKRVLFTFQTLRYYNRGADFGNAPFRYFDKSAGEYELKILRNGKLARSVKFTVKNGDVDDGGIAVNNKMGWDYRVLPVRILDQQDGAIDRAAWRTGAFYGNPLTGFVAP